MNELKNKIIKSEVHLTFFGSFVSAKCPKCILNHGGINMSSSAYFVIESDTIAIFRDHHTKFGEETLADFTGTVTVPFRETTNTSAFGSEWKIIGYRFKRRCKRVLGLKLGAKKVKLLTVEHQFLGNTSN